MQTVPSLDQLARDPTCAVGLPTSALAVLQAQCAAALAALAAAMSAALASPPPPGLDRLIGVKEAAARLGMHPDTLYRNASEMPFTVRPRPGQVRFSSNGIDRYIQERSNGIRRKRSTD